MDYQLLSDTVRGSYADSKTALTKGASQGSKPDSAILGRVQNRRKKEDRSMGRLYMYMRCMEATRRFI